MKENCIIKQVLLFRIPYIAIFDKSIWNFEKLQNWAVRIQFSNTGRIQIVFNTVH